MEMCEYWRTRNIPADLMGDVYDGNYGKNFLTVKGTIIEERHSLMLFLNVDWFQQFTHLPDSAGAIYTPIQNSPRRERYKIENIILVGIIPIPKEPKLLINSFLSHFVEELKILWHGVDLPVSNQCGQVRVGVALTGMGCDLPAVRKSVWFSRSFSWPWLLEVFTSVYIQHLRPKARLFCLQHIRKVAKKYDMAKTKCNKQSIATNLGVRSFVLLRLPYFNPIRFHVLDPMHNLLLGTAKRMMT